MTDHANELRRYSRKIGHPAGDVPSVMLAAADEIERLAARLEAAEKSDAESIAMYRRARDERDALRAALTDLLNDLEERAPLNIEKSPRVVACGNSVYVQAKAALEATP
jgi:siroheme synthase